ncbi:protein LNK2-like isoform X1 [Rosa rugosa]|uniref:protein LNK2-like isoform X1 n=1 Tax=Rosa rugosa TaxID=74645 RepID=UPI002B414F7D|nr:protein LNK2-like isoform X1 [Rosa rugosa]XP_061997234.1 protein LNK2-like isoform X1 [Rosa rugosa]XP_061997235.1 protein LNK2-like isoform X1 [Rosa rugosa]
MFDWNDQELANIIWGEGCESDDHIVPYPEATDDYRDKKERNQESDTIKSTEQKAPGAKVDLHGRKPESSSNFETGEGISSSRFETDSWPDLSLSSFEKTEQQCMGTETPDNLTDNNNLAEANQLDKAAELFQNSNEAKEQFVDYGWANIGSFDDLDQIFSNDDTIFSQVSLGNVDELWSSKDATDSPIKAFPVTSDSPSSGSGALRNVSEHAEIKTEIVQQDERAISPGYGKTDFSASHGLQNAPATLDHVEYAVGKSKPTEKEQTGSDLGNSTVTNSYQAAVNSSSSTEIFDKVSRQRKFLRSRKKLEDKNEGKSLQDFYGSWSSTRNPSGQFDNQLPSLMVQSSPTSVLGHKRQLQGPESFPYQPVSNQFVSQTMYGTLTNACQATPVLSHTQPGQIKHQNFLSGSDISPGSARNKSADTCAKPTMTTQEKIEKLRRRQQLQAMLAIRKQQQQFSHQVSCTNQPTTQKCPQENQIQHSERADLEVEDLSTFPSLDPNSPIEQDDSNTVSAAVEYYSAEDTILYRLQDIIAKLDIKTRLCIRDSLLRLAQSAVQRHHTSDTSSSNRNSKDEPEIVAKEEIGGCNRYTSMPDVETETNPIDRTVAHLLFHRPLDLSGKHSGAPESPASTKMPFERKTAGLASLSNGVLLDSLKNKSNYSHQESGNYCPDPEPQSADQNLPCMNKSENLSNNGSADGGTMEVEASN